MNKRINVLVIALLVALVAMGAAGDSNFTNVVTSGDITAGDDLTVTDDATVGGNLAVTGTSTVTGATTQTGALTIGGKLTVNDQALVDGDADEIQITVQGHTTQTTSLMVLEQSDGTDKLTVSNDGNTSVGGTLDSVGAFTAASVDSDAGVEVTTFFDVDAVAYAVTNGIPITPTGTYLELTATEWSTVTVAANADAGTVLFLNNVSAENIYIADTARNGGNLTLGQYDTLVYISDGTGWVELSRSNN